VAAQASAADPEPAGEVEAEPSTVERLLAFADVATPASTVEQAHIEDKPVNAAAGVPDDDLKRIEGIGPRMSAALVAAGIRTYKQLGEADEATIRAAIQAAGLRFAPSLTTWARQARLLADGDEAGFTDLTRRLVAGRDVGRV
jgi:predicted flap endonuclease-1-like 5' DNA nuclease